MNKKIRELVKKEFKKSDWYESDWVYHILPVVKYAKKLAKIYKVDEEVVELAALLHDIGRVKLEEDEEHHIIGVPKAERILRKYNYSEKIIKEVKHCIESHRTIKGPKPKTMIAKKLLMLMQWLILIFCRYFSTGVVNEINLKRF